MTATLSAPNGVPAGGSSGGLAGYRPRLRAGVRVSGVRHRDARPVHLVAVADSGRCFELGPREHYLITRMDGARTTAQLGADYAATTGRALTPQSWAQLLGLLHARGLLADSPAPTPTPDDGGADRPWRFAIVGRASRVVDVYRATRWLFHPIAQLVATAAIATLLGAVAVGLPHAGRDLAALGHPLAILAVIAGLCVSMSLHELAHGVAATRYGSRVRAFGLVVRFPVIMFCCRVDAAPIVTDRRARLVTAAAGVWANLVALLPVLAWWAAVHGELHAALGGALLVGVGAGLVNLLPVPPLDGYELAGVSAGVLDLAPAAARCGRETVRALQHRPSTAYPPRLRAVYLGYLVASTATGVATVGGLIALCLWGLPAPWGPNLLAVVLLAVLAALGTRVAASATSPASRRTPSRPPVHPSRK